MSADGIYGRTVTRAEYRADPLKWAKIAQEEGAITIVDSKGKPQAVISVPGPLECDCGAAEERGALRAALKEACEGWEEASQYKGEFLACKHGDADNIARLRKLLGGE